MRILVVLKRSPTQRYLISLCASALINEIRELIDRDEHPQAIALAFSKGRLEKEVLDDEVHTIKADLILSENVANWDLMR